MSDLAIIEKDVLELSEDAPADALLAMLDKVKAAKERLKEIDGMLEERAIEIIRKHGPIKSGEILWIIGLDKTTKCRDVRSLLATLLEITDVERIAECLAANAWKHGTVRTVFDSAGLGTKFDEHFEVIETSRVKVKALNTKFVRSQPRLSEAANAD